jgi:anti-sigma regulatory factor (Ser/Thr protein kinase)
VKALTQPDPEPWEYGINVPHDPRGSCVARAAIRAALEAHELPELLDRALLLSSEMLSNAYRHSTGEAQLRVKWAAETLRLTVWDTNPKPPDVRHVAADSESGRGMQLLLHLADRWGHYLLTAGRAGIESKVVWCEISRGRAGGQ